MRGPLPKTKHFQISQALAERIKYLAPGDAIPTVAVLMREFRVSQATITHALERLRKHGLIEKPFGRKCLMVADKSERSLCRVVFIRPSWPSPDFDCLVYAIQEAAIQKGWAIDIFCYGAIENLNIARAMESADAAVFVSGAHPLPADLKKAFRFSEKPVVFLRERPSESGVPTVSLDDYSVGKLATNHLLQLGHRRIVALASEPCTWHSSRRLAGWRDAMGKLKIPDLASLLADCAVQPGTQAMTGAYEKFTLWLRQPDRPKFSALFCLDWTGAMAAMRALREAGLSIPEDISVITFAGEEKLMSFLNPPLTTIEVNVAEFASRAIRQVAQALSQSGAKRDSVELVKPFLVKRESTRPYKKGKAHA